MPERENLGEAAEHTEYETSCSLSWTISETHERPPSRLGNKTRQAVGTCHDRQAGTVEGQEREEYAI